MKNKTSNQHEFAFFTEHVSNMLSSFSVGDTIQLSDLNLFHRIARVVRLKSGQTFVLFDRAFHVQCEIRSLEKNHIEAVVLHVGKNKPLTPTITFWLPLLKRDQFQNALYSLAECGTNVVQPVVAEKVQRKWGGQKEQTRSLHIMSAAAQQSKQFAFPELNEPQKLEACCQEVRASEAVKLFFDPAGQPVASVLNSLVAQKPHELILAVGSEGDLTDQEKELLRDQGFIFCALTPTILRAQQAVFLSAGLCRSFFHR